MAFLRLLLLVVALALPHPAQSQGIKDRGQEMIGLLNALRDEKGRAPLQLSERLARAASAHAEDMGRNGFFGHTGSDRSDIGDRVRRVGYRFCFIAENIAKGQGDVRSVLNVWAASSAHRRNMLSKQAKEFALVQGPGRIWVMVLGRDGC